MTTNNQQEQLYRLKKWVDDNYPNFNKSDIESKIDELIVEDGKQGGDMTAAEYFNGEGSPLTLDKICTPEEKEFLLEHIELYAKGKVYQALKSQPSTPVQDGWVSVTERLPNESDADENGKVLIYRNTNEGQKGLSKSIFDYFMVKNCESDTHWQPLPEPPKNKL